MKTIALLVSCVALLALTSCSSPDPSPTQAPPECPTGQHDAVSRITGRHHCIIPADAINVTPGCEPQAVQAFYDSAMWGDGGAGALACSAAGEAVCADDQATYDLEMAQAADAGVACPFR